MNGKKLNKIVSSAIEKSIGTYEGVDFDISDTKFHLKKLKDTNINDSNKPKNITLLMTHNIYDAEGDRPKINPKTLAKIILFGLSETNFYSLNNYTYHVSKTSFLDGMDKIEIIISPVFEK